MGPAAKQSSPHVIATLVWLQWTPVELHPQQHSGMNSCASLNSHDLHPWIKCCLHALRHLLQVTLESIVSAHMTCCISAGAPSACWEPLSHIMKYIYPADLLQHLVSQFHTMVTVSGSATQAGTKLAIAAFIAAPSGLRWAPNACDAAVAASGAAPASAESGPLAVVGGVASLAGVIRLRDSTPRACEGTRWCILQARKRPIALTPHVAEQGAGKFLAAHGTLKPWMQDKLTDVGVSVATMYRQMFKTVLDLGSRLQL